VPDKAVLTKRLDGAGFEAATPLPAAAGANDPDVPAAVCRKRRKDAKGPPVLLRRAATFLSWGRD